METKYLDVDKDFENKIRQFNLAVVKIIPDGNCLFRAVAHQVFDNEDMYPELREQCMDHIANDRAFYHPFMGGQDFNTYIAQMRQNGVWADNLEIQALSEMLKAEIQVFHTQSIPIVIFAENQKPKRIIRLFYNKTIHYDSIIEMNPNDSKAAELKKMINEQREKMKEQNQIVTRHSFHQMGGCVLSAIVNRSERFIEKEHAKHIDMAMQDSDKTGIEDSITKMVMQESMQGVMPDKTTLMDSLTNLGFPIEIALQAVMVFGNDEKDVAKVMNYIYTNIIK